MATSRSESATHFGRRRSNTAQSILRSASSQPLQVGDCKALNTWVHDPKECSAVVLNPVWWPGVAEGDMLRVTSNQDDSKGFLFTVPKDDGFVKPQLQISIPKPIAETFDLRNNGEVVVTKVDKKLCHADYVEFTFQDQYLGRNDMWRLGKTLVGQCVYEKQDVPFLGSTAAKIHAIYVGGKTVSSGYMTPTTKAVYRSLSAKVTIFIQVCRELWEFADDGERYNEKIVHSFLPELFAKWREAGTNHIVTIVLISRVFYDQSETGYAAGPLRQDDEGNWFKDFYKVITDLEVIYEWKPTLVSLKNSFWDFQRDILLTHHYHRAALDPSVAGPADLVRLVGRISYAHDGPILEAINLGLNPTETHYVDRSLNLTGAATIVITPGTGYFRVSKQLLRLTTTRMLDQGFGLDLISLAKPPLHQSPIFSFWGILPESKSDLEAKHNPRAMDPLWGGDNDTDDSTGREKTIFWWEPFWMSISFWDKQMDLPFRQDRFVARAKMHEIQMLGLLEHDVLSSIEVPFLPEGGDPMATPRDQHLDGKVSKSDADQFDCNIFTPKTDKVFFGGSRISTISNTSGPTVSSSLRSSVELRSAVHRNSVLSSRIAPIEESPRVILKDLPPDGISSSSSHLTSSSATVLSTSPSQSSMRSSRSIRSSSTISSTRPTPGSSRNSPSLKLAPTWLLSSFRSGPSQPQTSNISASAFSSSAKTTEPVRVPGSPKLTPLSTMSRSPKPRPVTIRHSTSSRPRLSRHFDEETLVSTHRGSLTTHSPMNTPPRDEPYFGKRRNPTVGSAITMASSSPASLPNPSQPRASVSYTQASLARRWQHMFPQTLYKHEIKWKSLVTPGCLPITVEQFPTFAELESSYDVTSYDFVVDPPEMQSFFVKPPVPTGGLDEIRRGWALVVMREMAAVRLAQGFQFVLRSGQYSDTDDRPPLRRTTSFIDDEDMTPRAIGASDILSRSPFEPVYLSMSNEIHRISYTGEAIQVRRYARRMPASQPVQYECLIWPKLGVGYTELKTSFTSHGLENYGWNRLDMLVAGYEFQFSESLRYWRTRFVVIPTSEPPQTNIGPSGESLNDEEIRLLGIDRLAETFSKLRWQPPEEKQNVLPPVRLLPTTLGPVHSVLDETLVSHLDEIHSSGPLRKKMKSERELGEMSLSAVAKAMREENGVPFKNYRWHGAYYPDSFTGSDFVLWLVREFRDISSRTQAAEWGVKLQVQGLFDHCRGQHGFLDGHYFYRLKGEYAVVSTPRSGWFRRHNPADDSTGRSIYYPGNVPGRNSPRRNKKRLILTQSMVIDIDTNKKSDQAEPVILHHDVIHNPATVFHFELQWIGTTAKLIEDLLRQWSRTIERYGLKLVEAYVTEISDIRDRNAFQSCFPLRPVIPPPVVPDIDKRVPEGTQAKHYFEYALLKRFGFVVDVEAADLYPEHVDVVYSYRRAPFKYSQFVHRSGVAFIQVLGGSDGFLFLTNRLMVPGKMGTALKSKEQRPAAAAEAIRVSMHAFCSNEEELVKFYDEEVSALGHAPEEPPPLSI